MVLLRFLLATCHNHDEIIKFLDPHLLDVGSDNLSCRWRHPPKDHTKLNVDGSHHDDGVSCTGLVV